ncbi:carbohydrate kinase [Dyadobacter subterraneus]|uniref:Carbohydrate kinase n=1 Tax=Dyadobacter subterraneus TaxID=2773304 RepID=A0ABR9WEE7_9BACT|nr:carbohydrate kinase [Dyadobacter subterraneus]MBE9463867.1 carbohydrate kinase [Dyadobacter subterraneus]
MTPSIVIFGEMLWDMLPSGKQPGGAPMNVAIHLKNFGLNPTFISRVGTDDLGVELTDYLNRKGLSTEFVQIGETHLTGIVKVNLTDKTEVAYKIVQPVAWDYIQPDPGVDAVVAKSDVFLYGSLAVRNQQTKDTLYHLLEKAPLKVFDVNLRPPHYDRQTVEYLLSKADIVKVNEHELAIVAGWYGILPDPQTQMKFLADKFKLQTICLTLGANGAVVLDQDGFTSQGGYEVQVQDTIGSGDSFLAMFLKHILAGSPVSLALKNACAVGAMVATYQGATPSISDIELEEFLNN